MGFGKKGLEAGVASPAHLNHGGFGKPSQRGVTPAQKVDPLAAQREAFIAAERARGSVQNGSIAASAPTEYAGPVPSYSGRRKSFAQSSFFGQFAPREPSMFIAYVLWFFLSNISAHRFYLGAHQSALMQIGLLFVSVILGFFINHAFFVGTLIWALWVLGDLFFIPGLHKARMQQSGYYTRIFS